MRPRAQDEAERLRPRPRDVVGVRRRPPVGRSSVGGEPAERSIHGALIALEQSGGQGQGLSLRDLGEMSGVPVELIREDLNGSKIILL